MSWRKDMTKITLKSKRRIIISAAVVFVVLMSACGNITGKDSGAVSTDANETMNETRTNTYRQISMDEAVIMMREETVCIRSEKFTRSLWKAFSQEQPIVTGSCQKALPLTMALAMSSI